LLRESVSSSITRSTIPTMSPRAWKPIADV
jgi:hypothetical protein